MSSRGMNPMRGSSRRQAPCVAPCGSRALQRVAGGRERHQDLLVQRQDLQTRWFLTWLSCSSGWKSNCGSREIA